MKWITLETIVDSYDHNIQEAEARIAELKAKRAKYVCPKTDKPLQQKYEYRGEKNALILITESPEGADVFQKEEVIREETSPVHIVEDL